MRQQSLWKWSNVHWRCQLVHVSLCRRLHGNELRVWWVFEKDDDSLCFYCFSFINISSNSTKGQKQHNTSGHHLIIISTQHIQHVNKRKCWWTELCKPATCINGSAISGEFIYCTNITTFKIINFLSTIRTYTLSRLCEVTNLLDITMSKSYFWELMHGEKMGL